jgi:hypothetical protein
MGEELELITTPAPFSRDELCTYRTAYRTAQAYLCGFDVSKVHNLLSTNKDKKNEKKDSEIVVAQNRRDAIIILGVIWGTVWPTPIEYFNTAKKSSGEDMVRTHRNPSNTQQLATVTRHPHIIRR